MKISVIANKRKDTDLKILREVRACFEGKADLRIYEDLCIPEAFENTDIVVALGGDGTIIKVAKMAAKRGVPVCGINMGKVGFLAAAEILEIPLVAEKLLSGDYKIENRMMLEVKIKTKSGESEFMPVLNDIVICRGAYPRMIELRLAAEGDFLDSYRADGAIISTPTGSTAYSLSSGGPVVSPTMELMLLTPICAFDLQTRSMVIPAEKQLTVTVGGKVRATAGVSIDGAEDIAIGIGDKVIIKKSDYSTKLISIGGRSFYGVLRKKLGRKYE